MRWMLERETKSRGWILGFSKMESCHCVRILLSNSTKQRGKNYIKKLPLCESSYNHIDVNFISFLLRKWNIQTSDICFMRRKLIMLLVGILRISIFYRQKHCFYP